MFTNDSEKRKKLFIFFELYKKNTVKASNISCFTKNKQTILDKCQVLLYTVLKHYRKRVYGRQLNFR